MVSLICNKLTLAQKAKQIKSFVKLKTISEMLKNTKLVAQKKLGLMMIVLINA